MRWLLDWILDGLIGPPVWRLVIEDGFTFALREDEVTDDHVVVTAPRQFRTRAAAVKEAASLRERALETPTAVL